MSLPHMNPTGNVEAFPMMGALSFAIGDKVTWNSSNTDKVGEVIAVVPIGETAFSIGQHKAGKEGRPRDHESYVVVARKPKYDRWTGTYSPNGPKSTYWPRVSLLRRVKD